MGPVVQEEVRGAWQPDITAKYKMTARKQQVIISAGLGKDRLTDPRPACLSHIE